MLFHHLTSFLIKVIVELAVFFFLLVGVLLCLDESVVAIIGCGFFISLISNYTYACQGHIHF